MQDFRRRRRSGLIFSRKWSYNPLISSSLPALLSWRRLQPAHAAHPSSQSSNQGGSSFPTSFDPLTDFAHQKKALFAKFSICGQGKYDMVHTYQDGSPAQPTPDGITLHFLHYFSANPGSNGGGRVEEKVLQKSPVEGGGRGQGTQYRGERGGSNLLGRRLEKEEEEETERGSFFASRRRRPGPYHCAFLLKSEEQKWDIVQSHWTIS